jgi:hypothetical protein
MFFLTYTMEFYPAIKKNDILLFTGKWIELENIILSEISKAQKAKAICFLSCVEYRANINIEALWKACHTKGRLHMRAVG